MHEPLRAQTRQGLTHGAQAHLQSPGEIADLALASRTDAAGENVRAKRLEHAIGLGLGRPRCPSIHVVLEISAPGRMRRGGGSEMQAAITPHDRRRGSCNVLPGKPRARPCCTRHALASPSAPCQAASFFAADALSLIKSAITQKIYCHRHNAVIPNKYINSRPFSPSAGRLRAPGGAGSGRRWAVKREGNDEAFPAWRCGFRRAGALDRSGARRDISLLVPDITPEWLSPEKLKAIAAIDLEQMPLVPDGRAHRRARRRLAPVHRDRPQLSPARRRIRQPDPEGARRLQQGDHLHPGP